MVLTNQEKILKGQDDTLTSVQACQDRISDMQKKMESKITESTEQ